MKRSTDRILTTHTGSLPRRADLLPLLATRDKRALADEAGFRATVSEAVREIVRKQREIGIDIVNDGEQGKSDYSTYIKDRLTGFDGPPVPVDPSRDQPEFLKVVAMHVELLNHATRDIAPERKRLHLCWGNYEGPHNHDIVIADILPGVFKARPAGISFEGAKPRHAHEWKVFRELKLPEGKLLIPGVVDSTTNFFEPPELVAERICNYARLVGRENVIAGTDCGLATSASGSRVFPSIAWAKLAALAQGARLASRVLW